MAKVMAINPFVKILRSCPDNTGLTHLASYGCDPAPQYQTTVWYCGAGSIFEV